MDLKSRLIGSCMEQLERRRLEIVNELDEIARAISNETKSSAGDKHETSRALMQNEREQIGQRLKETEMMINTLHQLDLHKKNTIIQPGSLVTTNKGVFLISIGFGSLTKDNVTYYFLSPQSPLGIALKGKAKGEMFLFNNQEYRILSME